VFVLEGAVLLPGAVRAWRRRRTHRPGEEPVRSEEKRVVVALSTESELGVPRSLRSPAVEGVGRDGA